MRRERATCLVALGDFRATSSRTLRTILPAAATTATAAFSRAGRSHSPRGVTDHAERSMHELRGGEYGMNPRRSIAAIVLCVVLSGCAEYAVVRSYPPGAKLYRDGQFEGLTPVTVRVPRSQFSEENFRIRLEHTGYEPLEGTLRTQVCGGRIAGGVFTLGIVLLFKRPTCFSSPQNFALAPSADSTAAPDRASAPRPSVDERLERIKRMRDEGTITNEEYDRYRSEILNDL